MQIQVSVIVLSYNPSWEGLRRTLHSVICQSGVDFEIIISDDGSKEDYKENIEAFFRGMTWDRYRFMRASHNQGTVKNILSALECSAGEYIYLTSPGDMLYDAYVMRDFYTFAKERQCDICFGNAIYYTPGEQRVVSVTGCPARVSLYQRDISPIRKQLAVFCDSVLGAGFFRSREAALKYIGGIAHVSKYLEDYTSSCYAILDGADIRHYDRRMLFYEYKTGISGSGDSIWQQRLWRDCIRTLRFLKKIYPENPVLDLIYFYKTNENIWRSRFYKMFRHPWLFVLLSINKCCPVEKTGSGMEIQKRLDEMLGQ